MPALAQPTDASTPPRVCRPQRRPRLDRPRPPRRPPERPRPRPPRRRPGVRGTGPRAAAPSHSRTTPKRESLASSTIATLTTMTTMMSKVRYLGSPVGVRWCWGGDRRMCPKLALNISARPQCADVLWCGTSKDYDTDKTWTTCNVTDVQRRIKCEAQGCKPACLINCL